MQAFNRGIEFIAINVQNCSIRNNTPCRKIEKNAVFKLFEHLFYHTSKRQFCQHTLKKIFDIVLCLTILGKYFILYCS
jgi:hypothetical protein